MKDNIHIIDHADLVTQKKITEEGRIIVEKLSEMMHDVVLLKVNTDPITMTKAEALQAMHEGKKVTHRHFSRGEWMTMEGNKILLEDGVRCSQILFWSDRTDASWENDYRLYTE